VRRADSPSRALRAPWERAQFEVAHPLGAGGFEKPRGAGGAKGPSKGENPRQPRRPPPRPEELRQTPREKGRLGREPADIAAGRDPVLAAAFQLLEQNVDPDAAGKMFPRVWEEN